MVIHIKSISKLAVVFIMFAFMQSCKMTPSDKAESNSTERGEPVLLVDNPVFDENSQSFSLTLHADSTDGAVVTYFLLDGDSLLMQSADGLFKSIAPLEEGYNVKARVEWEDTVIITPAVRVLGFVVPREPVEKLSVQDLQQFINTRDDDAMKNNLAQRVKLTVLDSQLKPSLLHDVLLYLENGVWESVTVTDVVYDDNNLITAITLKPVEHINPIVNDEEEYYDEY